MTKRNETIACSTAHRLATQAAIGISRAGGTAVDSAIAAHAVICVTMPQAAGLGGDLMMIVAPQDDAALAVTGSGRSANVANTAISVGRSVTVPGMVSGWHSAHERWGLLDRQNILQPAIDLARNGVSVDADLASAVNGQRRRFEALGDTGWSLLGKSQGDTWIQPELADLLEKLARDGFDRFYEGEVAAAIVAAARRHGSTLTVDDFAQHRATLAEPVRSSWSGGTLEVQPAPSQGVILSMASSWIDENRARLIASPTIREHLLVEATEAAFESRDDVIQEGESLLSRALVVNESSADRRGGPRGYVHTAGVAVATADQVVSSLVSVFDDFGSCVFVPELGITLNNRGDGFTDKENSYRPGEYPVHTLAPSIVRTREGMTLALATPGADGQVQTLLQVLSAMEFDGQDVTEAIDAPRWRSENGSLLIEAGHPAAADLESRGHTLNHQEYGDPIFGAVVAAGCGPHGLIVGADPRRGVVGRIE